jgi:hypothetical protein
VHFLTHPPTHHLLPSGTPPLADGSLEDFDESGAGSGGNKKESPEDAAARAKLEAARARESVRWVRGLGGEWAVGEVRCRLAAVAAELRSDERVTLASLTGCARIAAAGKRCRRG